MTHHAPIATSMGWICPRCDRAHAPTVATCDCHARRAARRLPPSVARIIVGVAQEFGVSTADLLGTCRRREFIRPRFAAIQLIREETGRSLPEIGAVFRRDHTSILHALRKPLDADAVIRMDRVREAITTADQEVA